MKVNNLGIPKNNLTAKVNIDSNPVEDFKQLVLTVNKELEESQKLKEAFIQGKDVPIYQIMIQSQKAKISLELLVKIRDEALKSYKEIVNIQV